MGEIFGGECDQIATAVPFGERPPAALVALSAKKTPYICKVAREAAQMYRNEDWELAKHPNRENLSPPPA